MPARRGAGLSRRPGARAMILAREVTVAAALALAATAGRVRADERMPVVAEEAPSPPPEDSGGRMLGGFALGLAATGAGVLIATGWGVTSLSWVVGAGVPAGAGFTVCGVMSGSPHYEGTCSWAVLGAYIGAATALPLALLGAILTNNGEHGGLLGVFVGAGIGIGIGTPLGALVMWNLTKTRRAPPAVSLARPSLAARDLVSGRLRLLVPVAAFTF